MEIRNYVAAVVNTIAEDGGFLNEKDASAKKAQSTAEKALFACQLGDVEFSDEVFTIADQALAWIRSYSGDNNYLKNLAKRCAFDDIGFAQANGVAALIPAFVKQAEYSETPAYGENSTHQGEVGEDIAFMGECMEVREIKRLGKQVVNFVSDGNVFTVWRSMNYPLPVEKGKKYAVIGLVKKHDVYNGRKQTVITGARGRGGGVKVRPIASE